MPNMQRWWKTTDAYWNFGFASSIGGRLGGGFRNVDVVVESESVWGTHIPYINTYSCNHMYTNIVVWSKYVQLFRLGFCLWTREHVHTVNIMFQGHPSAPFRAQFRACSFEHDWCGRNFLANADSVGVRERIGSRVRVVLEILRRSVCEYAWL